jgi:hypothetical protein
MDIDTMLLLGRLDDTFPLPTDRPFTAARASEAGVRRRQLALLRHGGLLRCPIQGVYLPTALGDSLELRVACLQLVAPPDCVVVDRHAGWLLGAQMVLRPGEHVDLRPLSLFRPAGNGRLRNSLADSGERSLTDDDVMEVHGMRVTTPLRTAWDLGRVRWTDEAISGLDAMFRLDAFRRDEFLAGISRFRGMRWVTTLRAIGPLADGRSESPGESVLRLRCIEANVAVTPQVEVRRGGIVVARLDLADEMQRLAFEYDGVEWHTSPEQVKHDRARRGDLRRDGWLIEALGCDDVFGRQRNCDRIIRTAARAASRRGRNADSA